MMGQIIAKEIKKDRGELVRKITGWALLASAIGTIYDSYTGPEASIGLIPLYIGFPIGAIGLVLIYYKLFKWAPTLILSAGLYGILYFMFTYPDGVNGWIGALLIGAAHLFLPLPGRFASIFWIMVGVLGFPEFRAYPLELFLKPYYIFGIATGYTGVFILWGLKSEFPKKEVSGQEN